MAVAAIVIGGAIVAAFLTALFVAMAKIEGWKIALAIWAFSVTVTAIVCVAALLIGYGVDRL